MNREFKIGLLALIAISALIVGVNYLKQEPLFNNNRDFYVVYQNIGTLQKGSPVLVNGYQVGTVREIDFLSENNYNLLVTISIDKEFNIPLNTVCKIVSQDLLGTKGVSLMLGDTKELADVGDTLSGGIEATLQAEVNAQILPLKNKTEELISSIDSVMIIITAVLNKDARENLRNSLRSLDETFLLMSSTMLTVDSLVNTNDERISKVIENLESITSNLESGNGEVKTILTNFAAISDSLAEGDITNMLNNMNEITSKINNGEGSLGLLMKDDKLYANFEKSTSELAELIEDIKNNPNRYLNFSIIGGSTPYMKSK